MLSNPIVWGVLLSSIGFCLYAIIFTHKNIEKIKSKDEDALKKAYIIYWIVSIILVALLAGFLDKSLSEMLNAAIFMCAVFIGSIAGWYLRTSNLKSKMAILGGYLLVTIILVSITNIAVEDLIGYSIGGISVGYFLPRSNFWE